MLQVRLKVDVFNLQTDELLCSDTSEPVCDSSSKDYGKFNFHSAFPLRGCAKGGRKVFMISDGAIAKDVEPRFLVFHKGRHLEDKDELLRQPSLASGKQVIWSTISTRPFKYHHCRCL